MPDAVVPTQVYDAKTLLAEAGTDTSENIGSVMYGGIADKNTMPTSAGGNMVFEAFEAADRIGQPPNLVPLEAPGLGSQTTAPPQDIPAAAPPPLSSQTSRYELNSSAQQAASSTDTDALLYHNWALNEYARQNAMEAENWREFNNYLAQNPDVLNAVRDILQGKNPAPQQAPETQQQHPAAQPTQQPGTPPPPVPTTQPKFNLPPELVQAVQIVAYRQEQQQNFLDEIRYQRDLERLKAQYGERVNPAEVVSFAIATKDNNMEHAWRMLQSEKEFGGPNIRRMQQFAQQSRQPQAPQQPQFVQQPGYALQQPQQIFIQTPQGFVPVQQPQYGVPYPPQGYAPQYVQQQPQYTEMPQQRPILTAVPQSQHPGARVEPPRARTGAAPEAAPQQRRPAANYDEAIQRVQARLTAGA